MLVAVIEVTSSAARQNNVAANWKEYARTGLPKYLSVH